MMSENSGEEDLRENQEDNEYNEDTADDEDTEDDKGENWVEDMNQFLLKFSMAIF